MKLSFLLFFILISLTMQAQDLDALLQSTVPQRIDFLVRLNDEHELNCLPLVIIRGKESGPVFTIVAGVHGYEYPPIIAVQELMKEIDATKLKGTLLILPVTNIASFYLRTPFFNPVDNKNLNTAFPGSASGTATEQLANWITRHIIPRSDVFLDIHGGDANEDLVPFVCYYDNKTNQAKTTAAAQLAAAAGMNYIVSYPYTISKTEPAKYAFKQAVQDGVTALSIEAGKLGNVQQENVQLIKEAVYRMLAHKDMYHAPIRPGNTAPVLLTNQEYIRVPGQGLFYSTVKSGDKIRAGQELGYITDEFGKVLHRISSPVNGMILYKAGTPPVNRNETLFCIGY
jgi:predicted deacylase